ncbi:MAG TPA: phosphoglycolate phosphatase [Burkholderiales bacterium]|nr:phosphoglycolate phosphatase [Burkholderiales bacterium]
MIKAVLFDLDGTFADTAPDLARALNAMRAARNLPPVAVEATRPVTSTGARGLLRVGFGLTPEHPQYAGMREEFLEVYASELCVETRLFPGMSQLLDGIERRGMKWGIVTNKVERLARPLIELLQLGTRCGCVIGGDTAAVTKPHPAPLLAASRVLGIEPHACVYVGDDRRDVEAGRAAGMKTIAVRYGYLNGGDPDTWDADAVVDTPEAVLLHI